jgi:uncharacterized SAM-binding protein YcdF (DUF218 family)
MEQIIENMHEIGPFFAAVWIVTVFCVIHRPQRYANSFLLMFALIVTMLFMSGFFGIYRERFLLGCFLLVMLGLFMVPALLIFNGVQMIRREAVSPAHLLSLLLGIVVGAGEIGAVFYVFHLSYGTDSNDLGFWVLLLVMTVFYFSFLVLSFVFYSVFIEIMPHRMNFNYVIIHGCGLAGGERMTKLLSNRVDKAIHIYKKCREKPMLIPSGGRGEDEKISEAQAMKDYLLQNGIPEESIIMEDRSATTRENLRYSKAIIDGREGRKKTALVSSNYHVYRCLRYAREEGLKCTGIGADVALYYWPSALIREFIAIFLTKKFILWALAGYLFFIIPYLYVMLV